MIEIKKYFFILMYLSEDIIFCIIDYLNRKELVTFSVVSKSISNYSKKNKFWLKFFDETFNDYKFSEENQNWRNNFISMSKLSKDRFKLLRKIAVTKLETQTELDTESIYSNLENIKWIKCDKDYIRNLYKIKIRTIVNNHIDYGYFITSMYLTNYDELYFSVYFVNNCANYDIFYKI